MTAAVLLALAMVVSYFGDSTGQAVRAQRYLVTPSPSTTESSVIPRAQEKLYPVLVDPYTEEAKKIFSTNNPTADTISGVTFLAIEEASGYFERNGIDAVLAISIARVGTNQFTDVPITVRRVGSGLFNVLFDTTAYADGLYDFKFQVIDPRNGAKGVWKQKLTIDNSPQDAPITGNLVLQGMATQAPCKCKKARLHTDRNQGHRIFHDNQPVPFGMVLTQPGSFSQPIQITTSSGTQTTTYSGNAFTAEFGVEGDPFACDERQGIRGTEVERTRAGNVEVTHLNSNSPQGMVWTPNGQYGYQTPAPGSMGSYALDDYVSTSKLKSYSGSNIFMTDGPGGWWASSPQQATLSYQFLQEVVDSDGKRKCRCKLETESGVRNLGNGIKDPRCVEDVPATCGDGRLNAGEECDDRNLEETDQCSMGCKKTTCGDGIIQTQNGNGQSEECDDGQNNGRDHDNDGVRCAGCKLEVACGQNWIPQVQKECDPPGSVCKRRVFGGSIGGGSISSQAGICDERCKCDFGNRREW